MLCLCGTVLAADDQFEYGFYERIRQEYNKNLFDLENSSGTNQNYFRFKTSVWGKYKFSDDLSLYSKVTGECKAYAYPSTNFDINEYVFDNLYVDVKNVFDAPFNLRIGRQNLVYGEGFLMIDGTPLDGSRTIYFNAVKGTLDLDNSDWDIFFIRQDPKDRRLPVINDLHRSLVEQKEEALGIYGKHIYNEDLSYDTYYIYKEEKSSPKTKLNTIGARLVYAFEPFTMRSEAAVQYGEYGEQDRRGTGGYLFFDYDMKDVLWSPTFTMGGVYLSGDDPATSKDESWDPLFSRWPYLSEAYAYILTPEKSIGYWTNTQLFRLGVTLRPTEKMTVMANCNYLRANENTLRDSAGYSWSNKERGWNPQLQINYKFNENVSSHILLDFFHPEGYYAEEKDDALFARWQVEIKL